MKLGAKTGLGKAALALCAGLCCTLMASAQAQSDRQNRQPVGVTELERNVDEASAYVPIARQSKDDACNPEV